jgi:putative nucleotidyltransferase with HDIG domain
LSRNEKVNEMDNNEIKYRLDKIENLPTLPAIAMEVNKMLQDYNTSIIKLSSVIENDQSISAKILKLVNSAFFGLRSKVGNIPHAVTILGFNTVRNAVISISVIKGLSNINDMADFNMSEFWRHSVSVAVASKHIADTTRLHNADDCFLGGLLHDIGKLVLVNNFMPIFSEIWKIKKEENVSFYEAEKKIGSMNHAQIGGYLALKWKLPNALADTILRHHTLSNMAVDVDLLKVIHSADIIINSLNLTGEDTIENVNIPDEISSGIKNSGKLSEEWFQTLKKDIDEASRFFISGDEN